MWCSADQHRKQIQGKTNSDLVDFLLFYNIRPSGALRICRTPPEHTTDGFLSGKFPSLRICKKLPAFFGTLILQREVELRQSNLQRKLRYGEELLQCISTTLEQIPLQKILLLRAIHG
jgi:hypothetical protein